MKRREKILVVGDDAPVRRTLRRVLARAGYRVRSAADGAAVLQSANTAPPDLVLLDLNVREGNGWDLFGRHTRRWPSLPVVIISARPNQLFTALAAGVGALLEKPLHVPRVLQTIRQLLRESVDTRLARVAGKLAEFHYLPTWQRNQACGAGAMG